MRVATWMTNTDYNLKSAHVSRVTGILKTVLVTFHEEFQKKSTNKKGSFTYIFIVNYKKDGIYIIISNIYTYIYIYIYIYITYNYVYILGYYYKCASVCVRVCETHTHAHAHT